MGGIGSGRYSEQSMLRHKDPRPEVTITDLREHNVFTSGQPAQWSVTARDGRLTEIAVFVLDDKAVIMVAFPRQDGSAHLVEETVTLSWSACHYGGRRPWFVCPGRFDQPCNRRVAHLYLAGSLLLCRPCCGLEYESDHQEPQFRALHRAQNILVALGGSGSLADGFPPRPKGMHYDTYHSLYWQMQCYLEALTSGGKGPMLNERKELERVLRGATLQGQKGQRREE